MIVADTSALLSLATIDLIEPFVSEFDVHTTGTVVTEVEDTAEYDDIHGAAAKTVIQQKTSFTVHDGPDHEFQSSRIDDGEGSCAILARDRNADFLITDDLRALPELQTVCSTKVAISPIVLKALVNREVLDTTDAVRKLDQLAENRDWLGSPIYRRAQNLFDLK